jgi:hypothetical protein
MEIGFEQKKNEERREESKVVERGNYEKNDCVRCDDNCSFDTFGCGTSDFSER